MTLKNRPPAAADAPEAGTAPSGLKSYTLQANNQKEPDLLDLLENAEESILLRLYGRVQEMLELDIKKINLSEALVVQYRQTKNFVDEVLHDKSVPANQRAQAVNTCNGLLEKITKMRGIVMNQERQRRYESAFLKTLDMCGTPEQRVAFMEMYKEYLDDRGQ